MESPAKMDRRLSPWLGRLVCAAAVLGLPLVGSNPIRAAHHQETAVRQERFDPAAAGSLATMVLLALHHANVTGNYTVLRDLASPALSDRMTPADLSDHFRSFRASRLDLAAIAGHRPRFTMPPTVVDRRYLWLEGRYEIQPAAIRFKVILERKRTDWRFISIEADVATEGAVSRSGTVTKRLSREGEEQSASPASPGIGPQLRGSM